MTVVMKGGASGNRANALPPVNVPFDRQPVQDTAGGSPPATVVFQGGPSGNSVGVPDPPVPAGGTPNDSAV